MKKVFFLGLFLLSALGAFAQDSSAYVYCQLVGTPRPMSTRVTVYIDYGQVRQHLQNYRIKDPEAGNPRIFNSMIEALNHMAGRGWVFEQALVYGCESMETHYILRKPLDQLDEEELKKYAASEPD